MPCTLEYSSAICLPTIETSLGLDKSQLIVNDLGLNSFNKSSNEDNSEDALARPITTYPLFANNSQIDLPSPLMPQLPNILQQTFEHYSAYISSNSNGIICSDSSCVASKLTDK